MLQNFRDLHADGRTSIRFQQMTVVKDVSWFEMVMIGSNGKILYSELVI
jgi:hypothetical protein